MGSAQIIGDLLRAHLPLVEVVPANRIKGGRLPDEVTLPALLVREVSIVDRFPLKLPGWFRSNSRVSVMVRAATYRDQVAIMALVRSIPKGALGTVAGLPNVVVHTAGGGPDVIGPADTFEKTQDFRVAFDTLD